MKNFVLLGACGYIAERHLRAIKDLGGNLVAAMDPHDSAGRLDSYFPDVPFFTEFERLDRHIDHIGVANQTQVDYVVVCSPNYLHDAHCRWGLRIGADVICEKPLCINARNVSAMIEFERRTGRQINVIQQLRLHPAIVALREHTLHEHGDVMVPEGRHEVELLYVTPRGPWYHTSWKGDDAKSGGVLMNLGVHFFDMLLWIFGKPAACAAEDLYEDSALGFLRLDRANVRWHLSTNSGDLPEGSSVSRAMTVDGKPVDFSTGFTELHTESYRRILAGNGFRPADALPAIRLIEDMRYNHRHSHYKED